jgi:hypothetical protein
MNPYGYGVPCIPTTNPALVNTKRFSRQKNWERPQQTETDKINQDEELINEKLKNYIEVELIDYVSINTHVRYRIFDTRVGEYRFRLGGLLAKKDTNYVVLSNGSLTWSVPKETNYDGKTYKTIFYRILNPSEMEQKKASVLQAERDQQIRESQEHLEELEKQRAEIEKLKKVIYKMSENKQLNADNASVISNAKRTLGSNAIKQMKNK